MPRKSKAKSAVNKEEEIAKLITEGTLPAELVRRGYARGTVYKVSGRLKKEGIVPSASVNLPTTTSSSKPDPFLDSDPDIIELRKAVRMAALEKQLAQIRALPDLTTRLAKVEEDLNGAWETIGWMIDEICLLPKRVGGRILS